MVFKIDNQIYEMYYKNPKDLNTTFLALHFNANQEKSTTFLKYYVFNQKKDQH
jgi:hypothetical protein